MIAEELNHEGTKTQRHKLVLENNALYALMNNRNIEVDQEAQSLFHEFQVCHQLRLVNWMHAFHCFHFDNQYIRNQQVWSKSGINNLCLL